VKAFLITIAILVGLFLLSVWGISAYLGIDDLKTCQTKPSSDVQCSSADAIVAVSGGDTSGRAQEAIELYQNGWGKYLIFSGAAADKTGPSNAEVMKRQAIEAGVDESVILTEDTSVNTAENAAETKSIFDSMGITSAILVTSSYHERRAVIEFRRRASNVTVRAHPTPYDRQWSGWWWLTVQGWAVVIPELVRSIALTIGGAK